MLPSNRPSAGRKGYAMNALSPLGMVSETPSSNQSATEALEVEKDYFVEKDGQKFAGMHLLVDLWGASNLCDPDHIDGALREAAEAANATILHGHFHHPAPAPAEAPARREGILQEKQTGSWRRSG